MAEFDPKLFGERLRALRGEKTQEQIGALSGVPDYVLARYERGDTEKPAYQHVISIGNALGYEPNEIAALAGLYALPGYESEQLGPRRRTLRQLESVFMTLSEDEQENMLDLISLMIETTTRRRNPKPEHEEKPDPLPDWFPAKVR